MRALTVLAFIAASGCEVPVSRCEVSGDASVALEDGGTIELRGVRYCEVLVAQRTASGVTADVYNTLGVSDCPQAAWDALDANALAREYRAAAAILNGPRFWLIDGFESSSLVDPAVQCFGAIPMRLAGRVQAGASASTPYEPRTIARTTTYVFSAGRTVFELIDDQGRAHVMQSWSAQVTPLDEPALHELGARLSLPSGWTYRARVISADLRVTAENGLATVVQDEFKNSYQRLP